MSPSFLFVFAGSTGVFVPHTLTPCWRLVSGVLLLFTSSALPFSRLPVCPRPLLTLKQRLYVLSFDAVTWDLLQASHTGLGI